MQQEIVAPFAVKFNIEVESEPMLFKVTEAAQCLVTSTLPLLPALNRWRYLQGGPGTAGVLVFPEPRSSGLKNEAFHYRLREVTKAAILSALIDMQVQSTRAHAKLAHYLSLRIVPEHVPSEGRRAWAENAENPVYTVADHMFGRIADGDHEALLAMAMIRTPQGKALHCRLPEHQPPPDGTFGEIIFRLGPILLPALNIARELKGI